MSGHAPRRHTNFLMMATLALSAADAGAADDE
jgi:hypothetical protein